MFNDSLIVNKKNLRKDCLKPIWLEKYMISLVFRNDKTLLVSFTPFNFTSNDRLHVRFFFSLCFSHSVVSITFAWMYLLLNHKAYGKRKKCKCRSLWFLYAKRNGWKRCFGVKYVCGEKEKNCILMSHWIVYVLGFVYARSVCILFFLSSSVSPRTPLCFKPMQPSSKQRSGWNFSGKFM